MSATGPPDLSIEGATIVTPRGQRVGSVAVSEGRIAGISERPPADAARRVDGEGLLAFPGFVDAHVHLMEPASAHREDWAHGTAAAAASGVTTLVEHTHDGPVLSAEDLEEKRSFVEGRSLIDFGLAAHVFPESIERLGEVWAAGAAYLKAFTCTTHGVPGLDSATMLHLLRKVAEIDGICLVHAEDEPILTRAEQELRAQGRSDGGLIPDWRSREAELAAAGQVLALAAQTGARTVIAHASSSPVLDLVASARAAGAPVAAEICPQYLLLKEGEASEHGALRKFTPPARARDESELERMWDELANEERVEYVSSDHAPSTLEQKSAGVWDSPFGLPGIDTTSAMLIDAALEGRITLERLAAVYSEAPARIYGMGPRKGTLEVGADADIVLVDPGARRTLSNEEVRSKAGWTPYAGRSVRGAVVATFLRGEEIFSEGEVRAEPAAGEFVPGRGMRRP
jgi:dihydroorotase (multifunctional complex type)